MRPHKPLPQQKKLGLSFTARRQAMREVQVGHPIAKALLWLVECHVGDNPDGWKLRTEDLAQEANCGVTTAEKWLDVLEELGFIRRAKITRRFQTYWMCWARVFGAIEEADQDDTEEVCDDEAGDETSEESEPEIPQCGTEFHDVESDSTLWKETPPRGEKFHNVECNKEERPSSAHLSAPPRPLSAQQQASQQPAATKTGDDEDRESILRELKDCGIDLFVQCLELAESRGVTLPQAAGVVEWFRRHPGRWPPGVLFERLTKPEARFLEASDGWFGEAAAWKAQAAQRAARSVQDGNSHDTQTPGPERVPGEPSMPAIERDENVYRREARYGPKLDAMTPAEVDALLADKPTLLRQVKRNGLKSPLFRPTVLEILETKLTAAPRQLSLLDENS